MANKTTAELKTEVGELLRLIGPGGSLRAEDGTRITNKASSVYERLQDMELAFWAEASIPELVFDALAKVVAGELAAKYWRGNTALMNEYKQDLAEGLGELREIAARTHDSEPTRAVYY